MAQYLEWHMSQVGAKDALLQQRLFAALSHLRQQAPPDSFQKASRYVYSLMKGPFFTLCRMPWLSCYEDVHGCTDMLIAWYPLCIVDMPVQSLV